MITFCLPNKGATQKATGLLPVHDCGTGTLRYQNNERGCGTTNSWEVCLCLFPILLKSLPHVPTPEHKSQNSVLSQQPDVC